MSKQPTHIIEFYPETEDEVMIQTPMGPKTQVQKRPSQAMLYRVSDGMCIAARQATVVSIGPDQKEAIIRTFRDETFATMYLRKYADQDWTAQNVPYGDTTREFYAATIEEVDCTEKVQKAKLARPSLVDIGAVNKSKK